jgi:hypothetical protein
LVTEIGDLQPGAALAFSPRSMGSAENSLPEIRGRQEMQDLVRATFAALENESMAEVVEALRDRVFTRHPDELLETTVQRDVCQWSFKPMVELMLREVLYLATSDQLPAAERRQEIAATIVLAGF